MLTLSEAFAEYRTTYRAIHPPPPKPSFVAFDKTQIGLAMVFILCLTIYAATRTAAVIEITEKASGYAEATARALAWVAVVGVEGMLLFMSITHTRVPKLYSQNHAWVLIVLGGVISALAGVSSGLGLFDAALVWLASWQNGVNIFLTLVLGVGATVMVWASGEFVGTAMHNHKILGTRSEDTYREKVDAYEQTLRERWDASPDKAAVSHDLQVLREKQEAELLITRARQQAELEVLSRQAQYDSKFANTHREKGVDVLRVPSALAPVIPASNQMSQSDMAYAWLRVHPKNATWSLLEHVPSAREIAAALGEEYGKDFSTGSTTRGRERYAKENHLNGQV